MCEECGCGHGHEPDSKKNIQKSISINRSVTETNDNIAHQISHSLKENSIFCINIMGSPGSGKTTLIEGLSQHLSPSELSVIQGDLESDIDKVRLEKICINTYQINTHSGCHLNSAMIKEAIDNIGLDRKKFLLIENVGNLVCPAGVDIGQHMNILVSSTTEGSDKPKKYPIVFIDSDIIVISKYDLKSAVSFDENQYLKDIHNINSKAKIIKISSKDPASFMEVAKLIKHKRDHFFGKAHHHHLHLPF